MHAMAPVLRRPQKAAQARPNKRLRSKTTTSRHERGEHAAVGATHQSPDNAGAETQAPVGAPAVKPAHGGDARGKRDDGAQRPQQEQATVGENPRIFVRGRRVSVVAGVQQAAAKAVRDVWATKCQLEWTSGGWIKAMATALAPYRDGINHGGLRIIKNKSSLEDNLPP